MKTIMRLNLSQVKDLLNNGDISGVCVLPMQDDLKDLVREFLKDSTGFYESPCIGVIDLLGENSLSTCWENLSSVIDIHEGDFILEFNIPEDLIFGISFSDFVSLSENDVIEKMQKFDIEDSYMTLGFTPKLFKKYCTDFRLVKPSWNIESISIEEIESLEESKAFSEVL